ncbi:toxin-antitoxin system HicB family antitoxin [Slackia exigua]|uniref:toxin-antitoxin system HicB family antitoxin n=1 Tax=Slackia exigua TaxID=84109 RepID=UPI00210931F9|nr:toxin-antitoxin system HicB family antitoxin [Slackia exigua]MCQ5090958.1 type II toxin-antitoxin system HicB family antitoxin [Slackia exigua]
MRYSELVEGNATAREIQEHLTGGETTTITLRIPGNLHESAKEAASLRGMSLSAFVRNCMIQELSKKG